ncbi:EamA family transporter [Pseudoalteromonas luteoviolacea]|uniref:EamA family transporter n=1 Tax=Pseudoalteromonas luteoviolacea TaxID=43657 RepID=UPI001B36C773|nr:EamA family transporter [Pseudoalteromonas luteoviolacea]MBQ4835053.1 EamA family transporter [Pseudoalteromonas luteoviolacea]
MEFALLSALCWVGFDYARKRLSAFFSAPAMSVVFSATVLPVYVVYWLSFSRTLPQFDYFYPATISGVLAGVGSVCFIRALALGKVAVMLPMLCLTPVIAGSAAWVWMGEALSLTETVAVAVLVLASFILQGGRLSVQEPGAGYILVTSFCWGLCIVFDKQALQHSPVDFHILYVTFIVLVLNSILFRPSLSLDKLSKHKAMWVLAALCFSLAVTLQFIALQSIQPGILEALKRAIGIIGAGLIGVYVFKEKLTPTQWTCVGVILCTSALFSQ